MRENPPGKGSYGSTKEDGVLQITIKKSLWPVFKLLEGGTRTRLWIGVFRIETRLWEVVFCPKDDILALLFDVLVVWCVGPRR